MHKKYKNEEKHSMYDMGVVVLNYNNYADTEKCVDGLLLQQNIRLFIVVIDNGSNNESYSYLSEKYTGCSNVAVLNSAANLGYSRGNNLGISYLREKNINRIFVCNSDIDLTSPQSLCQLNEGYEQGVGLIVPIITNRIGEVDQRVAFMKNLLYLRVFRRVVCNYWGIPLKSKAATADGSVEKNKERTGVQTDRYLVSGSGYILTEDFFSFYRGLYHKIFLYGEEVATILLLHKAGLKSKVVLCDPMIHTGGASTPVEIKNKTATRIKIERESYKYILQLLFTPKGIARKRY